MHSIANNHHWFRGLLSGTILFLITALVLAACSSSGGGGGGADLVIQPADDGWDFQVTASVSSAVVAVGDSFTLTAMVSNASDASAPSPANTLTYYQSSDATIDSSDTSLDTDAVASLAVGASDTQDITPTAPTTAGTYYYGACMPVTGDELNASDNCSSGVAVTVTSGWDFQVTAMVSSASVTGSTPFTLTAVVSNASNADGPTPTSMLSYYQSSDTTIDSSDAPQGTDAVSPLAAGDSSTESIDLTITSASGTYYYGACMPAASGEANATDNCSSGVAVTVTSGWDFQVSLSVSSTSVEVEETFTVTAVVSNAGIANQATSASTLTYYQSSDATIDSNDTSLGTDPVLSLAVNASDTQDITPTAPTTAGIYYYGACMPATGDELDTTNNCSAGVAVTVTSDWDFQVTASVNSANVTGSTPFTLTAMVSNASGANGPTPASTLSYYQSSDATISSADTELDTDPVASLAVGASDTYSIDPTAPTTAGTYYYGACMPATGNELNATDNCSSGVAVTFTSGWDFQVAASVSSANVLTNQTFTLTAEVSNAGIANQATSASTLTYYQSADATIDSTDTSIETAPTSAVSVQQAISISTIVTAPAAAGTYYYGACMPATGDELNASDNCSSGVAITVTGGWDFQVAASVSSANVLANTTFTLTAEVSNAGFASQPTSASTLTYYQSSDATIFSTDTPLGTDPVASLAVDASDTQSFTATAPVTAGTYYYGACMPATGNELNAFDNCSSGVAVTVGGWDFQVTASVSSTSVEVSDTFSLSAVVNNASDASAPTPASTLSYYQSSDTTIDSSDTELDTDAVAVLAAGDSSSQNFSATAPAVAGTYYYGACMPATGSELDSSDNCSAGVAVTVTGDWDFQVAASVSSATVGVGDSFTLTAVVSNASDASGSTPASTLSYYQSNDATIDSTDTELDTDAVASLAVNASDTQSFNATAPAVAGTYYYGACMPATGSELNTSDNCSAGVAVTVTSSWDFQVTASVSSASVTGSQPFTLTAEVSNASSASGSAPASTLTYYQSSDATISSSDASLDTDAVAALAVGNSSTHSISVSIFMASGTYYYGACMPAASGEAVASDNCSSGVAVTVTSGWNFDVTLEASSTSLEVGETFTLTAIVNNHTFLANLPTPASTLTYYVRESGSLTLDVVGTDPVAALAVGESSTQTFNATASETARTYIYTACVPDDSDLDTDGNCSSNVTVTVTEASGS